MAGYTIGSSGIVPEYINRILGLGRNETFTEETESVLKQYQESYYNSYSDDEDIEQVSDSLKQESYIVPNGIADIYTLPILCEIQLDPDNAYTIATAQFAMNVLDDKGELMVTGYYDDYPVTIPDNNGAVEYGSGGDWLFTIENSIVSGMAPLNSHTKYAIWNFQLENGIGTGGSLYSIDWSFQTEEELDNACKTWENSWTVDDQGNVLRVPATVNGVLMQPGGFYGIESDNHVEVLVHVQDSSDTDLYYQHLKVSIPENGDHIPTGYVDIPTWNRMRTVYGAGGI